uniref:Onychopsin n=1 Tax=Eoperipatus sp. LH-2012 TaxID=1198996 RepID=I6RAP7_9BILA
MEFSQYAVLKKNVFTSSVILTPQSTFTIFTSTASETQVLSNEITHIETTLQQVPTVVSATVTSPYSTIMATSIAFMSSKEPDIVTNSNEVATEEVLTIWHNATDFLLNVSTLWKPDYIPKDLWVHPHWYQFPQQSELMHFIFGLCICFLGILSVVGNFFVMWIFAGTKSLRTPSNIFVINLAFSDFMMMATNFPIYVYNSYFKYWALGPFVCEIYGFCGAFFGTLSIVTMAVISVDRYYVIVKPFIVMRKMNRNRAIAIIASVWIYVLAWCLPPFFGWNAYVPEGFLTTCSFDSLSEGFYNRAFVFGLFMGAYVLPLTIILYCYFYIFKEVAKHEAEFKKKAKEMNVASLRGNEEFMKKRREIKTAKIALTIIFLWIFAWTPYAVVALMGIFTDHSKITPLVSNLPAVFAKTASVYNPIVYAISHPKFRSALRKKFPWLICIPLEESKGAAAEQSSASISRQSSIVSNLDSVRGGSIQDPTEREPVESKTKVKNNEDENLYHDVEITKTSDNIEMKSITRRSSPVKSTTKSEESTNKNQEISEKIQKQPHPQVEQSIQNIKECSKAESTDGNAKDSEPSKNGISVPGASDPGTLQDINKEIIQNNMDPDIYYNKSLCEIKVENKNLLKIENKINDPAENYNHINPEQECYDTPIKIFISKENINSLPNQEYSYNNLDSSCYNAIQKRIQLENLLIPSYPPDLANYMNYFDPDPDEITISNMSLIFDQKQKVKLSKKFSFPILKSNYFDNINAKRNKFVHATQSFPGNSKYRKNLSILLQKSQEQHPTPSK